MAIRRAHTVRLTAQPFRQWFSRASLVLLVTVGLALMVMSKTGNPAVLKLRTSLLDAVTPVLAFAASPMNVVAGAGDWAAEIVHMRSENIRLKNENLQLLQWQAMAKEMRTENSSLKALMGVVANKKHSFITARIVSDFSGPYVHAALINGGTDQGVVSDLAVINSEGLIGRVTESGKTSARVLLLNDINSRVPVMGETTREKSILTGNNDGMPVLSYLAADSKIVEGERIVTTGDGGIFPAGVPVGIVASSKDKIVQVQPFVDFTRMEYVSVFSTVYDAP